MTTFPDSWRLMMKAHMPTDRELDRGEFLQEVAERAARVAFSRCAEEDFFPTNCRNPEDLAADIFAWLNTYMQPGGIPPKREQP
jgi:hypothetical protein